MAKKTKERDMRALGKLGAKKRWMPRYEIIVELSKYFTKEYQNKFLTWPTKYLKDLLTWVEEYKKERWTKQDLKRGRTS